MQYRSRLKNKVRSNTFLSIALLIGITLIAIFFGLQLLVKISLFLGNIKSINDVPSSGSREFVLPPTLDPLYEATNSATIAISGTGTPGQTVEIFLNDGLKTKVLVDNNSQFTISGFRLESGTNAIKARAKLDEKESAFTPEVTVVVDITPPALEIKEPADGQVVKNTPQVRILGKTEADTNVLINEFLPVVDSLGSFSYTMPLKEGENKVKITAKDKAGNQTTNEITIKFEP